MFLALVNNELRKIMRRGKTWVVFFLFVIFVGLCMYGNYRNDISVRRRIGPKQKLVNLRHELEWNDISEQEALKGISESDTEARENIKKDFEQRRQELKNTIKSLEEIIASKKTESPDAWKKEIDKEISSMEYLLKDSKVPEQEKARIQLTIKKYKYLRDNNIKPVEEWELQSFNFISTLMMILGAVFLALGIGVFMSDIVSGECTPPTLKFLLIQPVSRGKVLLSKFTAIVITCLTMILSIEGLAFLLVGLFSKFGNINYPVLYNTRFAYDLKTILPDGSHPLIEVAGSTKMISMGAFTFKAILLQALFIITCCAFVFLISSLFKSSMIAMALGIIIPVITQILTSSIEILKKIAHISFISYGNVGGVLKGTIVTQQYQNPNITISFGIIVMLLTIGICYGISHFVFVKKDILI